MLPDWTAPLGWDRWTGQFDTDMNVVTSLRPAVFHVRVIFIGDPPRQVGSNQFDAIPGSAGIVESRTAKGRVQLQTIMTVPGAVLRALGAAPGDRVYLEVQRKNPPRQTRRPSPRYW
jgi:hypothetical protein